MSARRILGIDPGSRVTGYGIIECRDKHSTPLCVIGGCIRLTAKDMPTRLGELFSQIQGIMLEYQPTECAIEQIFVHKSPLSALKLGQARGVAMAAVMTAKIPVYEYAPRQIKQAIVGTGSAEKSQVQHMIQLLLQLPEKPQADAADALAAALCHHHTHSAVLQSVLGETQKPVRRRQSNRQLWTAYDRTTSRNSD